MCDQFKKKQLIPPIPPQYTYSQRQPTAIKSSTTATARCGLTGGSLRAHNTRRHQRCSNSTRDTRRPWAFGTGVKTLLPAPQCAAENRTETQPEKAATDRRFPVCFGFNHNSKRLIAARLANVLEAALASPALACGDGLLQLGLLVGGAIQTRSLLDPRASALMVAVAHAASHCCEWLRTSFVAHES